MISKQYQFRANPSLEGDIKSVWIQGMDTSNNIIRIVRAGIKALKKGDGDVKKTKIQ